MDRRPLPSELSRLEQLVRAIDYRAMAATASIEDVRDALIRLAERYEAMADKAEQA